MSESATDKRIRELSRQLENEKRDHARTRNELQSEISRVWRLVPSHYINLMGVYPALRKLLHVIAEAADLQDPSRGAPAEDTMRTQFVHTGDNASSSHAEQAYSTHRKHRADVAKMNQEIDWVTHRISKLLPGDPDEYNPPDGECECGCGKLIFQNTEGRRRRFYNDACRQRALRKVEA